NGYDPHSGSSYSRRSTDAQEPSNGHLVDGGFRFRCPFALSFLRSASAASVPHTDDVDCQACPRLRRRRSISAVSSSFVMYRFSWRGVISNSLAAATAFPIF